jgi:hypothetical protein
LIQFQVACQFQYGLDGLGDLRSSVVEFQLARFDSQADQRTIRLGLHLALASHGDEAGMDVLC